MAGSASAHVAEETLHAHAAGELTADQAHAVVTHLEVCPACRGTLEKVQAFRGLLAQMGPPPLDDLRWARMARRIQTELRSPPKRGLDLGRWLAPAVLAAATSLGTAVLVLSWPGTRPAEPAPALAPPVAIAPPPAPPPAPLAEARPEPTPALDTNPDLDLDGARLVASAEPFELDLKSGLALRLAPRSEVRVLSSSPQKVVLHVARGRLEVSSAAGRGPAVELRAQDLQATARRGSSFTVALVSGAPAALQVLHGEVQVRRPSVEVVEPTAVGAEEAAIAAPTAPSDPWIEVVRAYQEGRYEAAGRGGRALLAMAQTSDERQRAMSMICDVELALDHVDAAIQACEAYLPLGSGHERRLVSFRLGQLYRVGRRDCERAIHYYDQMIVVGSAAAIDHEALLGRAECALDLGRLDLAARDLGFLNGKSINQPETYEVLAARLRAARQRKEGSVGKP